MGFGRRRRIMNQAIHNVDLLYWLMGDVESIAAHTATLVHERIEVEDTAVATLRFKNGALGVIEAATSAFPGLSKRTEIHGDRGSARVEQDDVTLWKFRDESPEDDTIRARFPPKANNPARPTRAASIIPVIATKSPISSKASTNLARRSSMVAKAAKASRSSARFTARRIWEKASRCRWKRIPIKIDSVATNLLDSAGRRRMKSDPLGSV